MPSSQRVSSGRNWHRWSDRLHESKVQLTPSSHWALSRQGPPRRAPPSMVVIGTSGAASASGAPLSPASSDTKGLAAGWEPHARKRHAPENPRQSRTGKGDRKSKAPRPDILSG